MRKPMITENWELRGDTIILVLAIILILKDIWIILTLKGYW